MFICYRGSVYWIRDKFKGIREHVCRDGWRREEFKELFGASKGGN